MPSLAEALVTHAAFTSKIGAAKAAIAKLEADGLIIGHMIDDDCVCIDVEANHIGHWTKGCDEATQARISCVGAEMRPAGFRHHSSGCAPQGGLRLCYR